MEKEKSIFDEFTRKYQLSKTLRFELRPVGKTEEFLKKNKVFEKDQTIDDSYNQAKFYFDELHREFINSALKPKNVKNLPFQDFANVLNKQNENISKKKIEINTLRKENKKEPKIEKLQKEINDAEKKIENKKKELYKTIRGLFDDEAGKWKEDYQKKEIDGKKITFSKADKEQKGVKFLTAAGILKVLKYEFPEEKEDEFKTKGWPFLYVKENENPGKKRYIFESFDKFSGYLSKFQQTRKNLYADDGTSTAVATRIVDNFVFFLQNKKVFDEKYKTNHAQIGFTETRIFDLEHYKKCLLQKDIEDLESEKDSENSYNKIIGRINKKIKEFRDQKEQEAKKNKKENKDKNNFKKSEYPLLKMLDKQMLGKVEKEKELIQKTEEKSVEKILIDRFQELIQNNEDRFKKAEKLMAAFFSGEFEAEYPNIYLKNKAINTISNRWFVNGRDFELKLPETKKKDEKNEPKIKKFISLDEIKSALERLEGDIFKLDYYKKDDKNNKGAIRKDAENAPQNKWAQFLKIWEYEFGNLFKDIKKENGETIFGYDTCLKKAKELKTFSRKNKEDIAIIKNYADAALCVFQLLKYLALDDKDRKNAPGQLSTNFYARYDEYYKDFEFIKYYNAFRNFITKKPFDEDKIKLNFEKGNLLGGWAESPEGNAQFCGYILKKDGKYFLGITDKPTILDVKKFPEITKNTDKTYQKMIYRQLKSQTIYGSGYEGLYGVKYDDDKNKISEKIIIKRVKQLIQQKYIIRFPEMKSIVEKKYNGAKELAKDLTKLNLYSLDFAPVNGNYIEKIEHNIRGEKQYLYLFEIINKDISSIKDGKKNIHTLYFEQLLSPENFENPVIKLSGGAEIFYRKPSIDKKKRIITKENKKILDKGEKAYKYNRYTKEKILFHFPIAINANAGKFKKFNQEINKQVLSKDKKINIIGIDRGEKNLLYYSVVNKKSEILEQGSLNKIKIGEKEVDFYDKLIACEKERLKNRQSWEPVVKIKDLKKGYISHVIHKICELIIKHSAIVALEDLNMRFKQIRGGIERSVYQQFEKALIDKLGYMVFKDNRDLRAPGGILNGYQLAAPFISFQKMGKQTGILFYTQADYTSITDPLTGFRKNIYISNGASQKRIREVFEKMEIGWDDKEQSYFFAYNPVDFMEEKYKKDSLSKKRTVYAKVSRIRREKDSKGYWQYESIDVNKKLGELFVLWGFDPKGNIGKQMAQKELKGEKEFDGKPRNFCKALVYYFNIILQLRNSFSKKFKLKENGEIEDIGEDIDFIASPVKPFFSTKAVSQKYGNLSPENFAGFEKKFIGAEGEKKDFLEGYNGDANGAYNIARKGIMILNKIKDNPEKPDLFITKDDWDKFVQKD